MDQTSRDTLRNRMMRDIVQEPIHDSEELRASSINHEKRERERGERERRERERRGERERERHGGGPLRRYVHYNRYQKTIQFGCMTKDIHRITALRCQLSHVRQKGNSRIIKCHIIICYYRASDSKQANLSPRAHMARNTRQKHV